MSDDKTDAVATDEFENTKEYKQLVTVGIEARKKGDVSNWELGDAADKTVKKHIDYLTKQYPNRDEDTNTAWGEKILPHYAKAIGIVYSTLSSFMSISRKYSDEEFFVRTKFSNLSWYHFKLAAGRDYPKEWLQKAQDNDWKSQELEDAIAESLGKKTSKQKTLERALDLAGMSPVEGLREILRLLLGHRADVGVELVVTELADIGHTLPNLVERDLEQIAAGAQYLAGIYSEIKGGGGA